MEVILATHNAGKLAEFQTLFAKAGIEIVGADKLDIPPAEETGLSFVENAILKARQACRLGGKPAIGDDSGLEVAALDGRPGIYSARYVSPTATASQRMARLLEEMRDVPANERQARFCCVLAYLRHEHDAAPLIAHGFCDGFIAAAPCGDKGFGYDPVLYLPAYRRTMAELAPEEKNRISHRGLALRALLKKFGQLGMRSSCTR